MSFARRPKQLPHTGFLILGSRHPSVSADPLFSRLPVCGLLCPGVLSVTPTGRDLCLRRLLRCRWRRSRKIATRCWRSRSARFRSWWNTSPAPTLLRSCRLSLRETLLRPSTPVRLRRMLRSVASSECSPSTPVVCCVVGGLLALLCPRPCSTVDPGRPPPTTPQHRWDQRLSAGFFALLPIRGQLRRYCPRRCNVPTRGGCHRPLAWPEHRGRGGLVQQGRRGHRYFAISEHSQIIRPR